MLGRDLVANMTWWRAPRWNILWPTPRWQTCWRASKCRPGKSPIFATRRVWTGRCQDGDGGAFNCTKSVFFKSQTRVISARPPNKNWSTFRGNVCWRDACQRECLDFITSLALATKTGSNCALWSTIWSSLKISGIGQLDVKSWDRTGMTIHQLSIFQPRSHAACKRVSKINKYGQFHDIYDGKLASLNFALEMDICHLYKFRHHSPAFCLTLFWKSRTWMTATGLDWSSLVIQKKKWKSFNHFWKCVFCSIFVRSVKRMDFGHYNQYWPPRVVRS